MGARDALATEWAEAEGRQIRRDGDKLRIGSRSFLVVFDSGKWHCFETGAGGDCLAFAE